MTEALKDAWEWCASVKQLVTMMDRISKRYWDKDENKTLGETLHRDNRFREIEAEEIQGRVERVLKSLDDLAILLLFSVFEADVRNRVLEELENEAATPPRHPVLKKSL